MNYKGELKISLLCWLLLSLNSWAIPSDQVVQIQGHYDENRRGDILNVNFSVNLTQNTCEIFATNAHDSGVWESVIYDGTNTYLLAPSKGHTIRSHYGETPLCGLVCPGRQYYMMNVSLVRTYFPWIVYCMRPQDIISDTTIPPSVNWRSGIGCYGWRWKDITTSPDGSFLQGFSIVRDKALDLDDDSELLRPKYEYPPTRDEFEDQMMYLRDRKNTPDGWLAKTYTCSNWYETNGLTIPASAEMKAYAYNSGSPFLISVQTLLVDKISLSDAIVAFLPPMLAKKTYVRDYRYTRRNERRMFRYADYVGADSWKGDNDPELTAAANNYLKYGPKMGDYGFLSMFYNSVHRWRLIATWLVMLLVTSVPLIMLIRKSLKQKVKGVT
jgi:hypothetical protein